MRADGYVDRWAPDHPLARADGYVFEHRMMAWDAGLLTDPALEVHHRNEVKDDNRLENFVIESKSSHQLNHHNAIGSLRRNQFGAFPIGQGFVVRHRQRRAELGDRICEGCGGPIAEGRRLDARFCKDACRVNAWKRQRS